MDGRTGWEATPAPLRIVGGLATIAVGCWLTWVAVGMVATRPTLMAETLMIVCVLGVLLGLYWLVSGVVLGVRNHRTRT